MHLAEFAVNNQALVPTGMSLFFMIYGQDPTWQFDFLRAENPLTPEEQNVHKVVRKMHEIKKHLQAENNRA